MIHDHEYYDNLYWFLARDMEHNKRLEWTKVRPGHPEGSTHEHVKELLGNLEKMTMICPFLGLRDTSRLGKLLGGREAA